VTARLKTIEACSKARLENVEVTEQGGRAEV
jgi:hypothetical protein